MSQFTGAPHINDSSRKMTISNISNIVAPVKRYHNLLQSSEYQKKSKNRTKPPKPVSNKTPNVRFSPERPKKLHIPSTQCHILPYKESKSPTSNVSTPMSSMNITGKLVQNTSQLSLNEAISNIDVRFPYHFILHIYREYQPQSITIQNQ